MALPKNCSTSPKQSSLIERANSCSGVLNISGVMWSGNLKAGIKTYNTQLIQLYTWTEITYNLAYW